MAKKLRTILVAVRDAADTPRSVLRKAATLAKATGARVELFHAVSEPVATQVIREGRDPRTIAETMRVIASREQRKLERRARSVFPPSARVSSYVAWDYPPHEAIVRRALAIRADLVIAATHPHSRARRLFMNYPDWELIRHCPCPLLLLKTARDYRRPSIIAAVDPFHARAKPAALDMRLLQTSTEWARLLRGAAHAFHAYVPLVVAVPSAIGQPMPLLLEPEMEELHAEQVRMQFTRLATRAGIPAKRQHLRIGDVPSTLAAVVKKAGASLVVMGAISRSALRRAFIGNTAEYVLDRLPCDVLVLKPRGFETRIPRTPRVR